MPGWHDHGLAIGQWPLSEAARQTAAGKVQGNYNHSLGNSQYRVIDHDLSASLMQLTRVLQRMQVSSVRKGQQE